METNSSTAATGDVQQDLTDDLLDVMNSYEVNAMDVFEEGNEQGTNVDSLTAGGESLVDVTQATGEPLAVVVQERIKKLEEKMKKSKEDWKPLQQATAGRSDCRDDAAAFDNVSHLFVC